MADKESRVDQDGNVWQKNWAGQYEQTWDFWNQRPERSDSERESQPDTYAWDGTPLYSLRERRESNNSGSSSSSDVVVAISLELLTLAFVAIGTVISEFRRPNAIILPSGKSPTLAAILSWFVAGTGQIYLGQRKKGILFLLIGLLTLAMGLSWLIGIISAIDAYGSGNKLRSGCALQEWELSLGVEAKSAWIMSGVLLALGILTLAISTISAGLQTR